MIQNLLKVKINYIKTYQALEIVGHWLSKKGKHYVVTPNPEMVVDSLKDTKFREALNGADLSIPDSPRLGWGSYISSIKSPLLRLISAPSFLFPHILPRFYYPTTTGVDLMEALLSLSQERGFTTAYLGGSKKVADRLLKCLRLKYPNLKIVFCSGNVSVDSEGMMRFDSQNNKSTMSKSIKAEFRIKNAELGVRKEEYLLDSHLRGNDRMRKDDVNPHTLSQKIDIMFVAFGHKKQEKWMQANLSKLNTRVMVGVGGAFDYLSGSVPRAPFLIRNLGFEWLFRLVIQPWRIRRFWKLGYFVVKVIGDR